MLNLYTKIMFSDTKDISETHITLLVINLIAP